MQVRHIQNPPETPYLDWIASGLKTYEGRLAVKIVEWDLYVGKELVFGDGKTTVHVSVTSLLLFEDFGEAYDALGQALIPGGFTRQQVVDMYQRFYPTPTSVVSSDSTRRRFAPKVVAIGIKVL